MWTTAKTPATDLESKIEKATIAPKMLRPQSALSSSAGSSPLPDWDSFASPTGSSADSLRSAMMTPPKTAAPAPKPSQRWVSDRVKSKARTSVAGARFHSMIEKRGKQRKWAEALKSSKRIARSGQNVKIHRTGSVEAIISPFPEVPAPANILPTVPTASAFAPTALPSPPAKAGAASPEEVCQERGTFLRLHRTGSVDIGVNKLAPAAAALPEKNIASERIRIQPSPVTVASPKSFSFEEEKEFWRSRRRTLQAFSDDSGVWSTPRIEKSKGRTGDEDAPPTAPTEDVSPVAPGGGGVRGPPGRSLSPPNEASGRDYAQDSVPAAHSRDVSSSERDVSGEMEMLKEKIRSQQVLIDVLKSSNAQSENAAAIALARSPVTPGSRHRNDHDISDFGPLVMQRSETEVALDELLEERDRTAAYLKWFRTELRRSILRGLDDIEREARRGEDGRDDGPPLFMYSELEQERLPVEQAAPPHLPHESILFELRELRRSTENLSEEHCRRNRARRQWHQRSVRKIQEMSASVRKDLAKERESTLLQLKLDSQSEMDRLRTNIGDLKKKVTDCEAKASEAERSLHAERQARISELEYQKYRMESESKRALQEVEGKMKLEKLALIGEVEAEKAKCRKNAEEKVAELESERERLAKRSLDVENAVSQKSEAMTLSHNEQLTRTRLDHEQKMRAVEEQMKQLETGHLEMVASLKDQHAEEMNELRRECLRQVEMAREGSIRFEEAFKDANMRHREEVETLKREFQARESAYDAHFERLLSSQQDVPPPPSYPPPGGSDDLTTRLGTFHLTGLDASGVDLAKSESPEDEQPASSEAVQVPARFPPADGGATRPHENAFQSLAHPSSRLSVSPLNPPQSEYDESQSQSQSQPPPPPPLPAHGRENGNGVNNASPFWPDEIGKSAPSTPEIDRGETVTDLNNKDVSEQASTWARIQTIMQSEFASNQASPASLKIGEPIQKEQAARTRYTDMLDKYLNKN